ncbi:Cytochrome P450 83B1 [Bienertia sinuspersici]
MLSLLLLPFIAVLSLSFFLLIKLRKNEPLHLPPGPKGLPIIGNLHQFDHLKPHIYFANLAITYGPILSVQLGNVPAVVVQSAKLAKEVLKTQDQHFCRRPPMLGTQTLSYKGLDIAFSQDADYFREIKKICVLHLLSPKRVESFAPVRQDEVSRLINKISKMASASQVVNLTELVMSFGSFNICRTAFGNRYGSDDDEGWSKRSRFKSLMNETEAMFTTFFFADYFPSIAWLDKLTGQSARLQKTFKDLDVFFNEILNDHLDPNRTQSEQEDLIDVLLRLRREGATTFELTLDHIKAVLMDIFVAGTDTSTTMVVWAMTELVKNPNAMKKVQEELRNVAGYRGAIIPEDLPKLEYFKAMVKETFRFHPANPLLVVRETLQKTNIQGYDIPLKTLMFVNVWAIGRDPEYWKDPEKYMPERFLGSSIEYKGQDFEFIPFGAGRKMCPGMHLGVANFELALANLLYSFDWELPVGKKREDIDTDTLPGVTMYKKNPLCLVPHRYI